MLVLSRKVGERIVVPFCDLTITVVAIEGGKVRLGITAPPEIGVYREEVWRQIDEEQKVLSPAARRVQANEKESSNPFFISVFHEGEPSDEYGEDD